MGNPSRPRVATDEAKSTNVAGPASPAQEPLPDLRELGLELTFVPQWARQPAGRNPYADFDERRDTRRAGRDRPGGGARDRPGRGARDRRAERPRTERRREGNKRRRTEESPPRRDRRSPAPRPVAAPVSIAFIPERDPLGLLVRDLRASRRAYRLNELVHLFLTKPECHAVKIERQEPRADTPAPCLYQCVKTKAIFLTEEAALAHALQHCWEEFYESEVVEDPPPAGHFTVIARCGLSGILLGPPNHHSYQERLQELHRERFAHMPLSDYRNKIETVRDDTLIEQWKKEQQQRTVYREKREGEPGPEMDREAAERHFREHHFAEVIRTGPKFVAPSAALHDVGEPGLRAALREAWTRESRRPYTLANALRPALRHMRLFLFRANGRAVFVTAVPPHPISPSQTIETIGDVLSDLHAHPGCTRQEMIERLRPNRDAASPEVSEVLNPLRWLIERGHVIEFYDGTLSVPTGTRTEPPPAPKGQMRRKRKQMRRRRERRGDSS